MPLQDPLSLARARIAEEAERRTGRLDLRDLGLQTLPEELFELHHLRELELGTSSPRARNRIEAQRGRLGRLSSLEVLSVAGSDLTSLDSLAVLARLQLLGCSDTQVADLAPLAGLTALQQLTCAFTPVADLSPLAGLTALQWLTCSYTQVSDLSPLAGLATLQQLDCSGTQVADLLPLAGLTALQQLDCSGTQVADLLPLAGLTALQRLRCSSTQVADLAPLAGLTALQLLDCSGCHLKALPAWIWKKSFLKELRLFEAHVAGIPRELLLRSRGDNCLPALRAHFADLALESTVLPDVRLLLIGNGRVGKTQIARWLRKAPFETDWNSTHGIQLARADLPGNPPATLQIWDFGGQDIYHGTHALFMRSPAVLALVWAEDQEELGTYEHQGLTFRNHSLAYWTDLLRHQTAPDSPVLIIQSKCDRPEQEVMPFPIPAEALKALRYPRQLHVSVKERYGLATLTETLSRAIAWLRDPGRLGVPQIGAGRLRVQRRLEAMRDADAILPSAQRRHRLLERQQFEEICADEGGVTDPALLLAYLDANGTVFYRSDLFGDRIVLDQSWALEAIYAVFDRKQVYRELRRAGGRFTRALLGLLIWRQHSDGEQKLLLNMMQFCGICFERRRLADPDGEEAEYIAPDLLPEREAIAVVLAGRWDEDQHHDEAVFRYDFLHQGLIRTVMAIIGEQAGPDSLYWRGGLCGYEATTRSRFLIEEEMTVAWQGSLRLRTQAGQAQLLLQKLTAIVEQAQGRLGMRPATIERPPLAREAPEKLELSFRSEKLPQPAWYVSYAWGDDKTPEGQEREQIVDDLCTAAEKAGHKILRDRQVLGLGDRISTFMRQIGTGDRIFVILSDKYLRSPYCMFELSEMWRTSRQEERTLLDRVQVYALGDADIWEPIARLRYAAHWRKKHDELEAFVRENGGTSLLGERDFAAFRRMGEFYRHVGDILATFADIVQPRSFEDLVRYGFD